MVETHELHFDAVIVPHYNSAKYRRGIYGKNIVRCIF